MRDVYFGNFSEKNNPLAHTHVVLKLHLEDITRGQRWHYHGPTCWEGEEKLKEK